MDRASIGALIALRNADDGSESAAEELFSFCVEALDCAPEFFPARTQIGLSAWCRWPEKARPYLEEGVRRHPDNPELAMLLGLTWRELEGHGDEVRWLRRAAELDPAYDEAFYNLGKALRDEDLNEARACFERAIEIDPAYGVAHQELGWCLLDLGFLDLAGEHLREAVRLIPESFWAHVYLGHLHYRLREFDEAVADFRRAGQRDPQSTLPLWCEADILTEKGEFGDADRLLDRALQLDPQCEFALERKKRLESGHSGG